MFTNITWKEYLITVLAVLFIYYAWVLFIFYAKGIIRLLNKKTIKEIPQNETDEMSGIVQAMQDEVKAAIGEAVSKNYPKQEIIILLQMVLEKYELKSVPFQYAINNFIERECKNNTSIHLNEGELKQLWLR
jgi:hypothetical protein